MTYVKLFFFILTLTSSFTIFASEAKTCESMFIPEFNDTVVAIKHDKVNFELCEAKDLKFSQLTFHLQKNQIFRKIDEYLTPDYVLIFETNITRVRKGHKSEHMALWTAFYENLEKKIFLSPDSNMFRFYLEDGQSYPCNRVVYDDFHTEGRLSADFFSNDEIQTCDFLPTTLTFLNQRITITDDFMGLYPNGRFSTFTVLDDNQLKIQIPNSTVKLPVLSEDYNIFSEDGNVLKATLGPASVVYNGQVFQAKKIRILPVVDSAISEVVVSIQGVNPSDRVNGKRIILNEFNSDIYKKIYLDYCLTTNPHVTGFYFELWENDSSTEYIADEEVYNLKTKTFERIQNQTVSFPSINCTFNFSTNMNDFWKYLK